MKWYGKGWISKCKEIKLDPYVIPKKKKKENNTKWIKGLEDQIIKHLEKNSLRVVSTETFVI
jgi:hypothetical protein